MATTSSQTPSSSVTYSKNSSSSQTPSTLTPHDPTVWDVFLSFRGADTRLKFVSHLYNALDYHGIRTYKDTPELRTGEVISDALIQAIHDSRIYIVVFSENYASSSWCLDELIEIYKCHEQKKRLVISVYYEIDPSVVRYQIKSFEQPFQKHEKRYAAEKVNQWRNTLEKVAGFSGQPVSAQSNEADIINEIVEVILLQIKPKTLYVAEYPIGIDYRVKHITALLSRDTEERLIRIGIYGMGGVGKTTLAKALYNQLSERNFMGSSFLAEVRSASSRANGLVSLQQQLLNDILNSKKPFEVHNVEEGIMFIRERICSRKILVLIDDVDELDQYQSLVGSFAPGSVIIITTRNEEMLDKIKVEPKYKYTAQVLVEAESLALFTAHAFGNAKPDNSLVTLFKDDILHLAGGLPLALKVFGSYLSTQSKAGWKAYIKKLKLIPSSTIQQKLLISLDAIELDDPMLKQIFLDIACFFIGMEKSKAVKILDTYYPDVDHNIDILRKRSLLTIEFGFEYLRMHDLLRDMGRDVARNRSSDEPAKHSRLWISKEICDVLKKQKGTETIEGIIPINFQYQEALMEVSFATKTFKRMSKLRFLYLCNVNLSGSFEDRFEELTWLCWDCCPLKCLPPEFWPQKLVILKLRYSKIIMWELNKTLEKLKTLDMSNSFYLTATPDFAKLPGLKTLRLKGCKSLKKVEISNGSLTKLVSFDLRGCLSLKEIHISTGCLMKLDTFNLSDCVKLRSINDRSCSLRVLRVLDVSGCDKLETLPDQLWKITSFENIFFGPHILLEAPFKRLDLSNSVFTALPSIIDKLLNLEHLDLNWCRNLLSVEKLPPNLKELRLYGCKFLESLNVFNLTQLEHLDLTGCSRLTEIQSLEKLSSIKELGLSGCNSSLHTHTLTNPLVQIYSGFGHRITISVQEFPNWFPYNCHKVCTYSCTIPPSSLDILAMVIFLEHEYSDECYICECDIKNVTSGETYCCTDPTIYALKYCMIMIPRSIISVREGDKLRLVSYGFVRGLHLVYDI